MSVQPKTDIVSNAYPVLPPVGSKIVALSGKERTIELIKIDDPAVPANLDAKIKNLESSQKSNFKKAILWGVAATVAYIVTAVLPLLAVTLTSGVGFIFLLSSILFISASYTLCLYYGGKDSRNISDLKTCRNAIENEEFRAFAKTFGKEFSAKELVKVHQLFLMEKQDQEIRKMNSTFKKETP